MQWLLRSFQFLVRFLCPTNKRQGTRVSISSGLHVDEEMAHPSLLGLIVGARLSLLSWVKKDPRSVQEELIKWCSWWHWEGILEKCLHSTVFPAISQYCSISMMTEIGTDWKDHKDMCETGPRWSYYERQKGIRIFRGLRTRPWKMRRVCCIRDWDCKDGHSRMRKQCEQIYQTEKCGVCPRKSRNFGNWTYLAGIQSICRQKGRLGLWEICALRTRRLEDNGEVSG